MHGKGTLTLKDGKSFSGEWIYDVSKEHAGEIAVNEKCWYTLKEQEAIKKMKFQEEKVERMID